MLPRLLSLGPYRTLSVASAGSIRDDRRASAGRSLSGGISEHPRIRRSRSWMALATCDPSGSFCGGGPVVTWFQGPEFRDAVDSPDEVHAEEAWLACATCRDLDLGDRERLVERGTLRARRSGWTGFAQTPSTSAISSTASFGLRDRGSRRTFANPRPPRRAVPRRVHGVSARYGRVAASAPEDGRIVVTRMAPQICRTCAARGRARTDSR
jgi:hypothetical protein